MKFEEKQKVFISENLQFNFLEKKMNLLIFEIFEKKTQNSTVSKLEFSKESTLYFDSEGKYNFNSNELQNVQFKIFSDETALYMESIAG